MTQIPPPRLGVSAYTFFTRDWREIIKAEHPDASFGETGRLLGAKWKELDDSEKKPYIELAARDKARAEEEFCQYKATHSEDNTEDNTEDNIRGNAPTLSAFMFFSRDWRERIQAENPGASFVELGKLLVAKWQELDDSEKKPYIELAARDKAHAEEEMSRSKATNSVSGGDGEDNDG